MSEFRALSDLERSVLKRLLSADFPGRADLSGQIAGALVQPLDPEGSFSIRPAPGSRKAEVLRRVPVEAEYDDADGVTVHVLLHVLDGYLNELEIYREDSGPLRATVMPDEFRLVVP